MDTYATLMIGAAMAYGWSAIRPLDRAGHATAALIFMTIGVMLKVWVL